MEIWDIGHSTRTEAEFMALLKNHKIKTVVDVRRFPSSKKFPHFERTHLEEFLRRNHLEYIWLGEKLGGFRKGGYEKWTKTKEFASGLKELEGKALQKRTAFLCAEDDYTRCHRRFIIEFLEQQGWKIFHIPLKFKRQEAASTPPLFSDKEAT